jgi:hypothetical protein
MRTILAGLAALVAAFLTCAAPASARQYPWCGQFYEGRGGDAYRSCSYVSWEQCRASTGLNDGFCLPNPGYRPVADDYYYAPRRKHHHRRHHAS